MGVNFWMEAGRAHTDEEKQQCEAGFSRNAFNQYASDRLGYFRDIPDTRHSKLTLCLNFAIIGFQSLVAENLYEPSFNMLLKSDS